MADEFVSDDRDWTWVLDRPCPECGFVAAGFDPASAGDALRRNARAWGDVLSGETETLTTRPTTHRWSALEYAAHVRDVNRLYLERLQLMLTDDDPLYADWDQDATAMADDYNAQDPWVVRDELISAASALGEAFDGVSAEQWTRPGRRSDGASFTVDSFARYLVHDPVHHLWDVTRTPARHQ